MTILPDAGRLEGWTSTGPFDPSLFTTYASIESSIALHPYFPALCVMSSTSYLGLRHFRRGLAWTRAWIRVALQEAASCRSCGKRVSPWVDVCEYCGTGGPVRVNVCPTLLLTAACCELALALIIIG